MIALKAPVTNIFVNDEPKNPAANAMTKQIGMATKVPFEPAIANPPVKLTAKQIANTTIATMAAQ